MSYDWKEIKLTKNAQAKSALGVVCFPRVWGVKQLERTESALGVVLFPRVCEGLSNLNAPKVP